MRKKRVRRKSIGKRRLEQDGGDDLFELPELEDWMVAGGK